MVHAVVPSANVHVSVGARVHAAPVDLSGVPLALVGLAVWKRKEANAVLDAVAPLALVGFPTCAFPDPKPLPLDMRHGVDGTYVANAVGPLPAVLVAVGVVVLAPPVERTVGKVADVETAARVLGFGKRFGDTVEGAEPHDVVERCRVARANGRRRDEESGRVGRIAGRLHGCGFRAHQGASDLAPTIKNPSTNQGLGTALSRRLGDATGGGASVVSCSVIIDARRIVRGQSLTLTMLGVMRTVQ